MASTRATNPIFKAITILHTPSLPNPTKTHLYFKKPTSNIPFFLSLSLQKPTFSPSTLLSYVAQSSNWDLEGSSPNAVLAEDVSNWDSVADEVSVEPQSSGFGDEREPEGEREGEGAEVFPEPPEEAKLFVGNLPFDVDGEKLAQLFTDAGVVEISEVIYNRETDRSRGFGFVTMSTVEEAENAVEMFNRYDLNGRLLTVNKAAPRGARVERPPHEFEPSFRIYVGNLSWDVDNARLEQVFSEHGKVLNARVVSDRESGRSRGFGFVTMASETEMNDAIAALDGQTLDGRAIRVNEAEERPRRTF